MMQEDIKEAIQEEVKEQYKESQMSKAGKLAMELGAEKKRLKKELEEIKEEVEDLTPTTPVGTFDWYVKWASMGFAVLGVFLISAGLVYWGQLAYMISAVGWIFVGMAWGDRAIMIGSAITGTAVAMNFVQGLLL